MACRFSGLPHTSTLWSKSFPHMASARTGSSWAARRASCPARHWRRSRASVRDAISSSCSCLIFSGSAPPNAPAALLLILWLLPLLLLAAFMVLLDVGSPVLFWQQRAGQGGRELQFYKLRTLRPP